MLKRQLYIQLISNCIIPILGFWLWNWSLYFILLFYILDILSSEIVQFLKVKKIKEIQETGLIAIPTRTYSIVSILFLFLIILEINTGMILYHPKIEINMEIWVFLSYVEMGIPQGVVLIPLIAMMTYTSYKVDFIVPKAYLHIQEKQLWKSHLKERFVLLSFCIILTLFAVSFNLKEWIVLVVTLVFITGYNYLQGIERISTYNNR